MQVRQAIFAGSWYPKKAASCEQEIEQFLSRGLPKPREPGSWMGGIVPHAGWYYSGQIACNVIHWLKDETPPDMVVLFGMHLHPGSANHIMPKGAWETPFGTLPVAEDLAEILMQQFDFQKETTNRFAQDNTIELQLPFVKYLLNPAHILAIGAAPNLRSLQIARAVVDWARDNGRRLKIIGSTDLTHYGRNYGFAPQGTGPEAVDWVRNDNDRRVIQAMLAMTPEKVMDEGLRNQNACCSGAAAAALAAVQHMGAATARELAYATSYDKSPGDSFVGYAGLAFG
jgi:MEMO1 family protein